MRTYEMLYIIDQDATEAARAKLIARFSGFLEKQKATNIKVDEWGLKQLAYEINYKPKGYYVLMTFTAEPEVPNKLIKEMNLLEQVIRHTVSPVKAKKPAKAKKKVVKVEKAEVETKVAPKAEKAEKPAAKPVAEKKAPAKAEAKPAAEKATKPATKKTTEKK
ncbi:MAG: 30S ribosomal protein S6 [Firmicutes bacterium]|nr:30S ribosomal protein S6 [Bacillota bacterium]